MVCPPSAEPKDCGHSGLVVFGLVLNQSSSWSRHKQEVTAKKGMKDFPAGGEEGRRRRNQTGRVLPVNNRCCVGVRRGSGAPRRRENAESGAALSRRPPPVKLCGPAKRSSLFGSRSTRRDQHSEDGPSSSGSGRFVFLSKLPSAEHLAQLFRTLSERLQPRSAGARPGGSELSLFR